MGSALAPGGKLEEAAAALLSLASWTAASMPGYCMIYGDGIVM